MAEGRLPVVVDALGGDHAPAAVVAGARRAVDELGIPVVLVGPPELVGDTAGLELWPCSEVVAMDEDPGRAIRTKKDSSLVRAAEAVRDGRAAAMVSAGNTGATMAAALLRMGRIRGVARPAICTPIPRPGQAPRLLLDAGANAECSPVMLLQFAQMGAALAAVRYGLEDPAVGLLSIGEEPSKGSPLVKEAHGLLAGRSDLRFLGNVEGRDLLGGQSAADVVVTDGFTGNVVLKALEGALRFLSGAVLEAFGADEEAKAAAGVLLPRLAPLVAELDPDNTGGAVLLGVRGVCVISHGSSSDQAILSAIRVAADAADRQLVQRIGQLVAGDQGAEELADALREGPAPLAGR
ncbi:phosphate acyltransferase PlsX [Aciditerrimonas ferrireducens]|jgi:glycerol-3-phosphate acyltransferase PlsX|uniref:Phosphate acyltransferase n=1 Tax=Aciditerrimonas ferrireducens TaxID=667306 RepID=A0ABV6C3L9_9ACTN|nr:phosphate acyltransferase PlsX [Aciditerrimonas ferrireducens]MCK4177948.1 phosphate acyltransferase PlsX [Aciditerrimonas ferrireducens]